MTDTVKNYVENLDRSLQATLSTALILQKHVQETEGDSDLYRKLSYYLIPSLNHWIGGMQAGNVKDLNELLVRRVAKTPDITGKQDDSKVLTKSKKKKK